MAKLQAIKGLYEKRGFYYYQPPTPKQGGKRPRAVALHTKDLGAALEKMEEERMGIALDRIATEGTLKEWLPRYYAAKADDARATRRARKSMLDGFMDETGNPRVVDLTTDFIERWRTGLMGRNGPHGKPLSGTTIKTYTITLRAFVNWLLEQRVIREDPMAKLKRQTRVAVTRRHEFLTEEQREKLLAQKASDEVRLILHLGFLAGMRDGEMLAMTPEWIWISPEGDRGTITVQETAITYTDGSHGMWRPKTRELRTIPMHPRLLAFLQTYKLRRPWMLAPYKEFWPAEGKKSKRYDAKNGLHGVAKRAGVAKLNYHMLRHTFATHLAMKGVALAEIAGLLGDSLRVTEEHYAGFCQNRPNPLEVL